MSTPNNESERSYEKITSLDLERLGALAAVDRNDFFSRKPRWRELYSDRILCVALCQGAALHYVDRTIGINDLDVYTFMQNTPALRSPIVEGRRRTSATRNLAVIPAMLDMRADELIFALGQSPALSPPDPVQALRQYLRDGRTKAARLLAEKAVVIIEPAALRGEVVWPERA